MEATNEYDGSDLAINMLDGNNLPYVRLSKMVVCIHSSSQARIMVAERGTEAFYHRDGYQAVLIGTA